MDSFPSELHVEYHGTRVLVRQITIAGSIVYHMLFADNRKPLVATIANKRNGSPFWTSVPEGRQQEAEELGALIEGALNSMNDVLL